MSIDDSMRYDLLDRLAEEFAARFRKGERPSLKEYTDRYPDLADEIREVFPALVTVERAEEICQVLDEADRARVEVPPLSQVGDYRIIRQIGQGGMGVVYEAEQLSLGRRVALKVLPRLSARDERTLERFRREARASARLHHTNIVPVFEVGQDGDIRYYAMQFIRGQSLDAVIGELRRIRSQTPRQKGQRLSWPTLGERPRASRPDQGPNPRDATEPSELVRTLLTRQPARRAGGEPSSGAGGAPTGEPEPGSDSSAVMPGGMQLSSVESGHRTYFRAIAQIGRQTASALAYAHSRGIIHRDIKPSNLLLDTEGVIWVSDFGLASVDEDDSLTRTGDVLGTLRYMAPERFRGQADARSDVYALGLTLYELLVLRPAFEAPDRLALTELIRSQDPPRPRSLDPNIPRDLETIVGTAIEKDPSDRYATAQALAEDLRRFLEDEPIFARPVAAPERSLRWIRRNPVIATLGGILILVLVIATISSSLNARRMSELARMNENVARSERSARLQALDAKTRADAARADADALRERSERNLYASRIGQADSALRLFDPTTARELLDLCVPKPGEVDRRGWEWSYLDQWCSPELKTMARAQGFESHCLDESPDGRLLAVGFWDPEAINKREFPPVPIYLVSLPDGRIRHALEGPRQIVRDVKFSRDGKRLAALSEDRKVMIWDAESGRRLRSFDLDPLARVNKKTLNWSPDGRGLTIPGPESVILIDADTGRRLSSFAPDVHLTSWSPDGRQIVLGLADPQGLEVHRWDVAAGRLDGLIFRQAGRFLEHDWAPGGGRIAATWLEGVVGKVRSSVTVHETAGGQMAFRVPCARDLRAVSFRQDGTRLAVGGDEAIVRVLDARDGREISTLFTGAVNVYALSYRGDGRRLDVAGWGMGGVKVFDAGRDPRGREITDTPLDIAALAYDPAGHRIRASDWSWQNLESIDPAAGTTRADGIIKATKAPFWPREDFLFGPDARLLAAPTQRDRTEIGLWDAELGRQVGTLRGPSRPVIALAFRRDGRALAASTAARPGERSIVAVWELDTSRLIRTIELDVERIWTVAFSPDGRSLAVGGGISMNTPGYAMVYELETGTMTRRLDGVGLVKHLAFHPDGRRIALADMANPQVHIWDLQDGGRVSQTGPTALCHLEFLPDGRRLVLLGYDGNAYIHDGITADRLLVLRCFEPPGTTDGFSPRAVLSPDGRRLVGSVTSRFNVWELGPRAALVAEPASDDLAGWLRRGHALLECDDLDGAEAAFARARRLPGDDPSPWIEHALTLQRRGMLAPAGEALDRALGVLPGEPGRWLDLGRWLGRVGWSDRSESVLAQARALSERRLSADPDDQAAAATLVELLPRGEAESGWSALRPEGLASTAGSRLTRLDDDSILAGGPPPPSDRYTVEVPAGFPGFTALRLEALPDPSLPGGGPGRYPTSSLRGFFFLDSIRVSLVDAHGQTAPVHLVQARSDYSHPGSIVRHTIRPPHPYFEDYWTNQPFRNRPLEAVYVADRPVIPGPGVRLQIELASGEVTNHSGTLGRFRLSVTDRPTPFLSPSLRAIRADASRDARTRLAAAYALLRDWDRLTALLDHPAGRPGASAVQGFLLALARCHRGDHAGAAGECDRAIQRLVGEPDDERTRDVGAAALVFTRGMTREDAEGTLADALFPADPFER